MSEQVYNQQQIAVILAHFECPEYLRAAIESIIGQTHSDWRLYVADDCSSSDEWFSQIEDLLQDSRIVVLQTNRNVGHYRIKNYIADRVSARWIAFQDADDISLPRRFETQLRLAINWEADVVGCSFLKIDAVGNLGGTRRMPHLPLLMYHLGKCFLALQPTFLLTRASLFAVRGFDGTARVAADSDFLLRALHLLRVRNVSEVLYLKRELPTSLTGSPFTGFNSTIRNEYRARMKAAERARRATPFPARLGLLQAPENDVEFDMKAIMRTIE